MSFTKLLPLALLLLMVCSNTSFAFVLTPTRYSAFTTISSSSLSLAAAESFEEDLELTRKVIMDFVGIKTEEEVLDEPKKKKPKKKKSPPPTAEVILDISKLDIRVGLITKAWEHEEADKLYCEEIDLGEEGGPRKIASGLKAHYTLDEMNSGTQKVLVLANLKSRKLVGFPSHGMVLCACENEGKVEFVVPPEDAVVGDKIICEGYDGEPATENQIVKKKMLNFIFPDLVINAEGIATYKGVPLVTSTGRHPCKASTLTNVPIS